MAIVPVGPAEPQAANGVRLRCAPELTDRLLAGMPLTVLGQIALEAPLGRLLVLGRSERRNGTSVSLAAAIMPNAPAGALALAPFGLGPLAGSLQPPSELRDRFPSRSTSEAIFVLDAEGRDQFVVGPAVVLNHMVVSCGSWPLVMPLFGPRTRAAHVADAADLSHTLDTFCEVASETINAIYHRQHATAPEVTLVLRPTGLNADAALGGLRWLGRGAAGLVSRLPRTAADFSPEPTRTSLTDLPADTSFDDVGGQDEAKQELQAICLAIGDPESYRRWGARPPKGVLLYGPPGTGKTLLARCLAQAAGARFFHVRATDITSKWYGEAEKRLQGIFERARKEAPAVLFFDEIDAIARAREDSHEATHRVVSTLLENMDGLEESRGIVVIAATNRPEAVDPALTRPGRFDRLVEVPLPDAAGRRSIFHVHLRKAENQAGRELFSSMDARTWEELLGATAGFSGAEIAEVVRRALEAKVRSRATEGQISGSELVDHAKTVARPW